MFKIGIRVFSKFRIMILISDFQHSRWRIQYCDLKVGKSLDLTEHWNTAIFEIFDRDLAIKFSKFKVAIDKFEGSILLKICIRGFSRAMIKILILDFRNSKWRNQYEPWLILFKISYIHNIF